MCQSKISPLEVAGGLDAVEVPLSFLEDTVYSCGKSLEALPLFVVRDSCPLLVLFLVLAPCCVLLMLSPVFLKFYLVKEVVLFLVFFGLLLFLQTFSYLVHIPLSAHVIPCNHKEQITFINEV